MATIRWYLVNGVDANGWQPLSETAQGVATCNAGWVVGTGLTNSSELQANAERSAGFTANTVPDGTLDTTLKDAFRTPVLRGTFASANWTFQFAVVSTVQAGAADGQIVFRLIKANADGSSPTEITSAQQSASVMTNVGATDINGTLTFNPGAITLTDQYLFVQIAWKRTGAGGMTTTNIRLRTGSSTTVGTTILSADFTPAAAVTGATIASSAQFFNTDALLVDQAPAGADLYLGASGRNDSQTISGHAGVLHSVSLYARKTGSPTDAIYLDVREGSWNGPLLGRSVALAISSLSTSSAWVNFQIPGGVTLVAGTTYYIETSRTNAALDFTNCPIIDYATAGTYSGGSRVAANGTVLSTQDLTFRLYVGVDVATVTLQYPNQFVLGAPTNFLGASQVYAGTVALAPAAQFVTGAFIGGGAGGFVRLGSSKAGTPDGLTFTTPPFTVPVGTTLLVGVLGEYTGTPSVLTNNHGDAVVMGTLEDIGFDQIRAFWIVNPTPDAAYALTSTRAGSFYPSLCWAWYSGGDPTAPLVMQTTGQNDVLAAPLVPTEDGCLLLVGSVHQETGTTTTLLTEIQDQAFVPGTSFGTSLAEEIQTTATTRNPTVTVVNALAGLVFKPGAGGGGGGAVLYAPSTSFPAGAAQAVTGATLAVGSVVMVPTISFPGAGYTLIGTPVTAGGPSTFSTPSYDTTGANLLVVVATFTVGTATLSDNKGNTWLPRTEEASWPPACRIFYAQAPIVGSGHTVTLTGSAGMYGTVTFMAFAGAADIPYDVESAGLGGGGFSTTANPGALTPNQDGSLIITGCGWDQPKTMSVAGFTLYQTAYSAGVNYAGGGGFAIQTTAASVNPTWTASPSGAFGGNVVSAAFKPASGPVTQAILGATIRGRILVPQRLEPFTYSNGNLTAVAPNWAYLGLAAPAHNLVVAGNQIRHNASGVSVAYDTGHTYSPDQYAQIVYRAASAGVDTGWIGVAVRCDTADPNGTTSNLHYTGYWAEFAPSYRSFGKVVAGTFTGLQQDTVSLADGDLITLEVRGSVLTLRINGVVLWSVTDTAITSGAPGIFGEGNDAAALGDNWEGGDIAPTALFAPTVAHAAVGDQAITGATISGDVAVWTLLLEDGTGLVLLEDASGHVLLDAAAGVAQVFPPTVTGAAAQSITTAFLGSGATLTAPTVTTGAVTVIGATIPSGATLTGPTVATGAVTVIGATIPSTATLTAPTVAAGAVTVIGATITSTATLPAPTVTVGAVTLIGVTIASTATLTPPTVAAGAVTVIGATLASAVTLTAPTVAPGPVTITGATLASGAALTAPTVTVGAVTVIGATITSTATLTPPDVATVVGVTVSGVTIPSTATLTAPTTVTVGAVTLIGATITSTATLTPPTVAGGVITATIPGTATLTAPTVAAGIVTATIAAGSTLTGPTVTTGAVTLIGVHIASTATLTAPTLAYAVTGATIGSTVTLTAPTIVAGTVTLAGATIPSGAALMPPLVERQGETNIGGATIASGTLVMPPRVALESVVEPPGVGPGPGPWPPRPLPPVVQRLRGAHLANHVRLRPPTVALASPTQTLQSGPIPATSSLAAPALVPVSAVLAATVTSTAWLTGPRVTVVPPPLPPVSFTEPEPRPDTRAIRRAAYALAVAQASAVPPAPVVVTRRRRSTPPSAEVAPSATELAALDEWIVFNA